MNHRVLMRVMTLGGLLLLALAATAQAPLGSSEQFKIDQVNRSLDNVAKDLERVATAGREDAAAMALKGAQRNLDQARDRFDQFASRHQDLLSHPDVEAARSRMDRLADSLDDAEPATLPAEKAGGFLNNAAGSVAGTAEQATPDAAASFSDSSTPAPTELSRKQRFELQQIGTSIKNAEGRLDAFRQAERDDLAALSLNSAKGGHAEAVEELEEFISEYPASRGAAEVVALRERTVALASAIEQAESGAAEAAAVAASAGADATADAERVLALRSEHDDAIRLIHGNSLVYYDNADAVREALGEIESAENAAGAIRPFLLEFRERYGSEQQSVRDALDAAGAQAESDNFRVASNAATLHEFLEKLAGTRAVSAETVAEHVAGRLADIDDYSAKVQQQRMSEAVEMIRIGQAIDPNNPRLNRMRGEVAQLSEEKQAEQMARIGSATWPGHVAGFEGPGSVEDLSGSIQSYLANDRDWGQSEKRPQEVLAVSVTGPWQVAAKDMFGRPIQWRLPVMVAITDEQLKPDGVAQAFEVSMVAKEGAPNAAPKSPPWDGFWVGDNYYLEIGKLP